MQQLPCVSRTRRRTCWLILSCRLALDGPLTQLASPRFEEKEGALDTQIGIGNCLIIPSWGETCRPAKRANWTSMSSV
jgi:hypothetical protein